MKTSWKYALAGIVSFIVGVYMISLYINQSRLMKILLQQDSRVKSQLESFDAERGRGEIYYIPDEAMHDLIETRFSEMKDRIDEIDGKVTSGVKVVAVNNSSGGGKVVKVKDTCPVPETKTTDDKFEFTDWRLKVHISGENLKYELSQQFEIDVVQVEAGNANPYFVSVFELDSDGKRLGDPLSIKEFSVYKSVVSETGFYFHPTLAITAHQPLYAYNDSIALGLYPGLSAALWSYGEIGEDTPLVRFPTLEVLLGEEPIVGVCPASYNVAKHIPILTNLYMKGCYLYRMGDGVQMMSLAVEGQL